MTLWQHRHEPLNNLAEKDMAPVKRAGMKPDGIFELGDMDEIIYKKIRIILGLGISSNGSNGKVVSSKELIRV